MSNNNAVIDVPSEHVEPPTQALAVRDPQQAIQALDKLAEGKPAITAAQAKIEAVANLTASAYSKASELRLTPEESAALLAPFQDPDFQPGAAGKENLIYIQHSALRDRFTKVLGLGQWALIARSRWAQEDRDCTLVFVEAMLLIRGCFVSEAIGDMAYWPRNKSTNYGDAVEGATTQAFRRCAKHFGVGLQAWDKDWCKGWWDRRNGNGDSARQQQPIQHPRNTPQPAPTPAPKPSAPTPQAHQGDEPMVFPLVDILMYQPRPGSKPRVDKAGKPMLNANGSPMMREYVTHFCKVSDGFSEFEVVTFDQKIGDLAKELYDNGGKARLVREPGRTPGKWLIVSLERAADMPAAPSESDLPFDNEGQPMGLVP